jgi:superfamily II DNA helicase RecQ
MQLKICYVSEHDNGAMQDEMNLFLRTHKVIRIIDSKNVDDEGFILWSFMIWYVEGEVTKSVEEARKVAMRDKYKEEIGQLKNDMTEEQKEVFEHLRKCRQAIAEEDAIQQNFNVFSDKELLFMATMPEMTEKNILEHEEIKKERKEKYAKRVIEKLKGV